MNEQAPLIFGVVNQEAAAIVLSVIVAIVLGWIAVRAERHIAAARLSFETVERINWDADYIEKRQIFIKLRDNGEGLEKYASVDPPQGVTLDAFTGDRAAILAILNDRENTAIGIRRGILDEEYLFRYSRSGVIADWEAASAVIIAWRRTKRIPLLFVEFEGLATQWQNDLSYRTNLPLPPLTRTVQVK
jgi:hypothetical protein